MQIEVTEKEALEIYEQRYMKQRRKKLFILTGASIAVTLVLWGFVLANCGEWQALLTIVLLIPVICVTIKTSRNSGRYARSQIEEQG